MAGKKHLFIGFGSLASQCTETLLRQGDQVVGVSRSSAKVLAGMTHWQGDVRSEAVRDRISSEVFDSAVITLTPDGRGPEAYRAAYYESSRALLSIWQKAASPPSRILFISSTSVYGQSAGEEVDEYSPTTPSSSSAKILCETETLYLASALPTSVLRFSGIYGPGRDYLLRSVSEGNGGDNSYTNRIHADDCCAIIGHLLQLSTPLAPIYLASDKRPVTSRDIRRWLAQQLGMDANTLRDPTSAGRGGNKRCCGKLLEASGYCFIYPDFETGYREEIAAYKNKMDATK